MEIHSCAPQLEYFSWTPALLFSFLMTRVVSSLCSLILLPTLNAACVWFGFSRPEFASWPFSYMLHHELMHSYHVSQFSCCFRLCVCVPWNVCVEVPTLKVMVFRGGALQTFLVFIVLRFRADFVLLQVEGLRQPCVKQVYQCQFSNCIFSLRICVSHFGKSYSISKGLPEVAQWERISLTMKEMQFWSLGRIQYPLEKEMTAHSSVFSWKSPWTEEPGGLRSMGSQRARHDWAFLPSQCFKLFHDYYAWYDHLQSVVFDVTTMTHWSLRHWLVFFSNKVFVNYVQCFLKDILHTW